MGVQCCTKGCAAEFANIPIAQWNTRTPSTLPDELKKDKEKHISTLKSVNLFLRDYLKGTTHPGVSRLTADLDEVIAAMKGTK